MNTSTVYIHTGQCVDHYSTVYTVYIVPLYTPQGPSKALPTPVPNKFTNVAHLFFFPLMNRFDQPVNTLDLLGQDSLVLGNLLYTLGTVMYAATNLPLVPAMAAALLDFLWALKYHPTA